MKTGKCCLCKQNYVSLYLIMCFKLFFHMEELLSGSHSIQFRGLEEGGC